MLSLNQRVIIGVYEGLGKSYYDGATLPTLHSIANQGLFKHVNSVFPSTGITNTISIIYGAWPAAHGMVFGNMAIPGSTSRDATVKPPTLFQRARAANHPAALLSSTRKIIEMCGEGLEIGIAADNATPDWKTRLGKSPPKDPGEINRWLWQVAIELLQTRPDIKLLCIHTNDHPMNQWAPDQLESQNHLQQLDELLAQSLQTAPDAAVLLTGTHSTNHKKRCWDLAKVCQTNGYPLNSVRTPGREIDHSDAFVSSGCAWIKLGEPEDEARVYEIIDSLEGVESILSSREAAARFHLPVTFLGDLMVLGDRDTIFGQLNTAGADLADGYRSNGSLHETDVPLIVYNQGGHLPPEDIFETNKDLTRFLYR